MDSQENQLAMYSIAKAAQFLKIGRDTLKKLIAEGKIGVIYVTSKRKKITYNELLRFQNEMTIRKVDLSFTQDLPEVITKTYFKTNKGDKQQINSRELLQKYLRN